MAKLELLLVGSPQIYLDGQAVTAFNTRKDCALLAYLAVTGAAHSRETLAGLLWSELPEENARRNLRHALSHLKKVIGPQWLVTERAVGLTQDHPWSVDVHTLRSILRSLTKSLTANSEQGDAQTPAALAQVLQLYRGEFLQGFHVHEAVHFEEWVLMQREELHLLTLRGLEVLVQRCLAQGVYEQGLTATRQLLQLEPWCEPAHRWQMQLLAQSGRRAEALAQFKKCREVLATELGVEPEQATVALAKEIRAGQYSAPPHPTPPLRREGTAPIQVQPSTAVAPPVAFVPAFSHNLSGQLTPFIGRDDEIAYLRHLLLSPEHRLFTIAGEGGIGKTRLAMAVAQAFVDEGRLQPAQTQPALSPPAGHAQTTRPFPDGIGYVSLAGLTLGETLVDELVTAAAKALHIQFSGKEPLIEQLYDHLCDKALLLLFDNVEHLLPQAADFLVALLQNAPWLKVLATSRHLLNLQAEVVVRLKGLPTPPPQEAKALPAAALLAYGSVALFVERAQRANPAFRVTPTNQAALVQICRLVNGLPLAIELAATQTRKSTCQQILTALQASYTVLNSTQRDLAPRHRSIRVALDYSWQFLSPETAHLLAACSIFPGPFDSLAVAAVMGGAVIDATLESLFMLVDQSLVQLLPSDENADQPRFTLHELIRQYGADQLQTQPAEVHRLRTVHCRYYLTLLTKQSRIFVHDLVALQQMQSEIENLRAAWAWADAQGQWDLLAASAYPLRQFYDLLSLSHEAESNFGRAVTQVQQLHAQDTAASPTQQHLIAQLLTHQTHFYVRLDQFAQAEEFGQAALALGRQLDDPAVQSDVLLSLSTLYGHQADWAGALGAAEQALVHAQAAASLRLEASSLQNIGCSYLYRGDVRQGLDYLQRALALYQALAKRAGETNHQTEGSICLDLAIAYQSAGDLMQAHAYYQQVVEIYRRMSIPSLGVYGLACLSELHLQLGCFDQARVDAELAWEISRSMGSRIAEGTVLGNLAYAHYQLGDLVKADQICQMLFDRIKPLGLTLMLPFVHFMQGELRRFQKQWQAALAAYAIAQQEYIAIKQMARAISTQAKMAQVWLQLGDLAKALAQVEEILPYLNQTVQNNWLETTADYWICYQVLAAATDPRARAILQQGYQHVQAQADQITDEALRYSYLNHVAANRALVKLATEAGIR